MSQPANWGVPSVGPATPTAYASRDNGSLDALLSGHLFTARPAYALQGTLWNKDTGASPQVIEQYWFDGTDDILIATFDVTANTVLFSFAAAQDFSLAGAYFGGNAAKNLFKFYEEDVFTPFLTFDTPGDLSVTYAIQDGRYTIGGNKCHFDIGLDTSAFTYTTASGNFLIGGLPVAAAAGNFNGSVNISFHDASFTYPASRTWLSAKVISGGSSIQFFGMGGGVVGSLMTTSEVLSGTTPTIRIAGSYTVA